MVLKAAGRIEELRGCLSGQVGWLLGHRAARFCCAALPPLAESTSTR